MNKQFDDALATSKLSLIFSQRHPQYLTNHIYILGEIDSIDEAIPTFHELKDLSNDIYVSDFDYSIGYRGIGDLKKALDHLKLAYKNRDPLTIFLMYDPRFDKIRNLSRFKAMVDKLNFPQK